MTDFARERQKMVSRHLRARGIDEPRILAAFSKVPRERFVPDGVREFAYRDGPLPIGEGQTISQPFIVAQMIALAGVKGTSTVLEVGAGSGYAAAVLSRIAKRVTAMERYEILAQRAREVVSDLGYANCEIVTGDGMDGHAEGAPFDAILVAARSSEVPEALKQQLAIRGRLVIPVGKEAEQTLSCLHRTNDDRWEVEDHGKVRFVPLVPGEVNYPP